MKKLLLSVFNLCILSLVSCIFSSSVLAHEAYVLTPEQFNNGLKVYTRNPLAGLLDTTHIQLTIIITLGVMLTYTLAILWSTTKLAGNLDKVIRKLAVAGPLIIRLAISASFFYAAQANTILGPEISLDQIPGGSIIRLLMYVIAAFIFVGLFTEFVALVSIIIFLLVYQVWGGYLITYANYFGELLVLFLFGNRFLSLDSLLFGKKRILPGIEKYQWLEVPIVRILYGLALIYAAVVVKFDHQNLTELVYNEYHLKDFFHASASFIASGAGLSELLIGLFIVLGFAQRLTVIISLVFITLSLLYFKELVWPHFLLYGISLSLIINSADPLALDRYLIPWVRKILKKIK